jgi:hypothetical protein
MPMLFPGFSTPCKAFEDLRQDFIVMFQSQTIPKFSLPVNIGLHVRAKSQRILGDHFSSDFRHLVFRFASWLSNVAEWACEKLTQKVGHSLTD